MASSDGRDPAFETSLAELNFAGARLGYVLAAILMPAGFALDLVVVPGRVLEFLSIRLIASALSLVLLGVTYLPAVTRHPVLLGAGPPLLCAMGIETMIVRIDAIGSPYYAGLNLCTLAVAVLYTWRWSRALAVSSSIVLVWVVPTLPAVVDGSADLPVFLNNLYFLTLTGVITVAAAALRYRAARREFDARWRQAQTSEELSSTLSRLQELDRLKNELFANVSHELRTPLTLILTPLEDLLGRELPPDVRGPLQVTRRNAQRLLRLIDDLLDLARLDAGGLRLNVAELDLLELVARVCEAVRPAAEARGMTLQIDCQRQGLDVYGDPHRLEMVLTNLLGNALKFTPDGGQIRISVETLSDCVRVGVRDTGPGIAADDLPRVFDRFYQVERSARRRHGGAGIGLSLAKKLVELHGGEMTVESVEGQGAAFFFEVPLGRDHFPAEVIERRRVSVDTHPRRRAADQSAQSATETPTPPSSGREAPAPHDLPSAAPVLMERGRRPRVLVAEDEVELREYIQSALQPHYDVTAVADGSAALEVLKQRPVDLVLTDLMMPGVSGIDLCRTIRADRRRSSIPVVVLTALSSTDNVLEAYSAGADDFVTKPFHSRVLLARISAQLKLRAVSSQLANQARLSTAGLLAAGVAHEIKNPLNAILNAARTLPSLAGRPEIAEKMLNVIVDGSQRIEGIISHLEEHAHPADGATAVAIDLTSGLESTLKLVEHRTAGIAVHCELSTTRSVSAPARELNQVFLNLIDNAVRSNPTNLWVRAVDDGRTVKVSVMDDGGGITSDDAALIFEPFFTTRRVGEGTGLGLYLSRQIVYSVGGDLYYRPRDGGGSVFTVELPIMDSDAPSSGSVRAQPSGTASPVENAPAAGGDAPPAAAHSVPR